MGLRPGAADDDPHGARGGRADIVQPGRRSAIAGGGNGADFFEHDWWRTFDEHLVSLRDHVRGAVYFDGAGCRDARGKIHGAGDGRASVETVRGDELDAERGD